jgi:hypothetical protein
MKSITKFVYPTFAALVLACFALSPTAQAQLPSPPPDGGYPNGNTAEGDDALFSLTTGLGNTANGANALFGNTSGSRNTAVGSTALYGGTAFVGNGTGNDNTAVGYSALFKNTPRPFPFVGLIGGKENTATGSQALYNLTGGKRNTAMGFQALYNVSDFVDGNTAIGYQALYNNQGQSSCTAGPYNNTGIGLQALYSNTCGGENIALGHAAGYNLTTGSNNIDIGNEGVADEANTIRIGTEGTQTRTFIAGISGTALGGGVAVRVNANGRLGTAPSSARFKQNIKPMDKASEAILALKPVTFHYKKELDPEGILQFGLVAEEVEKVSPDLVARDDKGKIYTVRYDAVNAMLLNEFLKEHGQCKNSSPPRQHRKRLSPN